MRLLRVLGILCGAVLPFVVAGCGYLGDAVAFDPKEFDADAGWVSVRDVPVVLQKEQTDCGAAALSMVLTYWKIPTSMHEVTASCPLIPDMGIKARDLRDLARKQGLQSFLI